jgi:ribosomal protein S27E
MTNFYHINTTSTRPHASVFGMSQDLWFCNDCGEPNQPHWVKCHNCHHTGRYYPGDTEHQCENCGYWHGQHILTSSDLGAVIGKGRCPRGTTMFEPCWD